MAKEFSPERLLEARKAKGWRQLDLAFALRTSEKNVRRWEGGENVPRSETVADFAGLLEREIEFFYVDAVGNGHDPLLRAEARRMVAPLNDAMVSELYDVCRELQFGRPAPVRTDRERMRESA